jgi:pyrimidine deaminase RibD-like protein
VCPDHPERRQGLAGQADADRHWLARAVELSKCCPPADSAFCVGAILVSALGEEIARGYSRQVDARDHAEEVALAGAAGLAADLSGATLYTSLEPCLRRGSRPVPCTELVLRRGVRRVVYAWREPPIFQPGGGAAWLEEHGVTVIEMADLAAAAQAANRALLDRR